jgi:hypothetical protein
MGYLIKVVFFQLSFKLQNDKRFVNYDKIEEVIQLLVLFVLQVRFLFDSITVHCHSTVTIYKRHDT